MKKTAIIVAAGTGTRMGKDIPKQFIEVCGRPILFYTIEAFLTAFDDMQVVLVMHADHMERAKDVIVLTSRPFSVTLITGGTTRYASVREGLSLIDDESIVFVHDGVRCLLTPELVKRCYEGAIEKGNAVPAISAVDSLRIVKGDENIVLDRSMVRAVQTPQTFRASLLKKAYAVSGSDNFTDDAAVAEHAGIKINLVEGETTNIKVTHPLDLVVAEKIIEENKLHCKE